MLLNDGQEDLYHIDLYPFDAELNKIYLSHLGTDEAGMYMEGPLPRLWTEAGGELVGPQIYDDNYIYQVTKIDYQNNIIWLRQLN